MATDFNQSKIAEVKDQMSLDYADGKYLNVIGGNLGLNRPVFGFSDAAWRAIIKELALDYKLIVNKFHSVLAILFGPQETVSTNLSQDAVENEFIIYLNNTESLPQRGELVLDKYLSTQETVEYSFIDRRENAVFLVNPLAGAHSAVSRDASAHLLSYDNHAIKLLLSSTDQFPTTGFPHPVVIGAGTDVEETVLISGNNTTEGSLSLLTPPSNLSRKLPRPRVIQTTLLQDYPKSSFFIRVTEDKQFPESGLVKLGSSDEVFVVQSGTVSEVTVSSNTFTPERQARFVVRFEGNVTSSLEGVERTISSNTDSVVSLSEDLPASPASGDEFSIRPVFAYSSINRDENTLNFKRDIVDISLSAGTLVELLRPQETVSLAHVKALGVGWSVRQASPRIVDIFISEDSLSPDLFLRDASYIHTEEVSPSSTIISSSASAGEDTIAVNDTSDFPIVGAAAFSDGESTEEILGYYVVDSTTLALSTQNFFSNHSAGDKVSVYQPVHGASDILLGDFRVDDNTFQGPYIYNSARNAPTGTVNKSFLVKNISGPSKLVLDQSQNQTAIEVEDASHFDIVNFPYTGVLGEGTGRRETVTVVDVNLKSRALTDISSDASIGDEEILVTSLSNGAAGEAADFPDSSGYRVIIDRGTADEEVVVVTGVESSPSPRLLLQNPLVKAHTTTPQSHVELMSDVISVSPLVSSHTGVIPSSQRSTAIYADAPVYVYSSDRIESSEVFFPVIPSIELDDVSGMDVNGGRIFLNFGNGNSHVSTTTDGSLTKRTDTTLSVLSTSGFPSTGSFFVVLAEGSYQEEVVSVSVTNPTTLELDFPPYYDHTVGEFVVLQFGSEEEINYDSISGNVLSLPAGTVLQSNHPRTETTVDSSTSSDPGINGYGFPFFIPPDLFAQVEFLVDLIRAAGVQVRILSSE